MATITWPSELFVSRAQFGIKKAGVQWRSNHNGWSQSIDFMADRWVVTLTMPMRQSWDAGRAESMANFLAGGVNFVDIWHFGRPVPVGTMRGSPLISSGSTRGADQIAVLGSGTLKAGDMLGVGNQVFQVREDVTVTEVGVWVKTVNRVRSTINVGASVVWDRPKIRMQMPSMESAVGFSTIIGEEFSFDLEEVIL